MIVAVLDHLWQSTLFAAMAGLVTLVLRENGARIRYWLWFAASAKFLVPFSLLAWFGSALIPASAPAIMVAPSAMWQVAVPFSHSSPVAAAAPQGLQFDWMAILIAAWAAGSVAVLAAWGARAWRLASIVRSAADLPLAVAVPVKSSPSFLEPGLVGVVRPLLLLPDGILTRLTAQEMNGILAHELCHLRRRDNLTAAIHMLVEALFWFHPLIWWLGARLVAERERACDEAVLESGSDPEVYAEGILKVCKFYLHSPLACAAGVSGADLKTRVEKIMTNGVAARLCLAKKLLLGIAAAAALTLPIASGMIAAQPAPDAAAPDDIARRLAEQEQPRRLAAFDASLFDNYAGYYELSPIAILHVTRDGNRYFAQMTGQPKAEIFPESDTKFFYTVVAAQISFVSDRRSRASGAVLHQNGLEQPARRISESEAKGFDAALQQRIRTNTPGAGTEAFVRRRIAATARGQSDYSGMTPGLTAAVKQQQAEALKLRNALGAFKSIRFARVSPQGADIYEVTFEHGRTEWFVTPPDQDGNVAGLFIRPLP